MSEAKLYSLLSKAQRLMYKGEPKLNCFSPSFSFSMAKPKSPNLHCPFFNKIFSDLISLCTIPVSLSLARAQLICFANICTKGSGSPLCEVLIRRQRSPPSQNSVIIKQKLAVSKISLILMVKFELQASWHRISFSRRSFCYAVLYTALSITLTQTNSNVQASKPTQTSPLIPLPSLCSIENQYFPSFFVARVSLLLVGCKLRIGLEVQYCFFSS